MPTRSHESSPFPHDPERHTITGRAAEPRNPDMYAVKNATSQEPAHAGFDADLNPIDDEFINTRGSER